MEEKTNADSERVHVIATKVRKYKDNENPMKRCGKGTNNKLAEVSSWNAPLA